MSTPGARGGAASRIKSGGGVMYRTWRALPHERRLAVGAALGLFVTLFLPWYQDTVIAGGATVAANLRSASVSITGWGAFSFVEAAVLLVAAGVLVLLYVRAQGQAFHIPGGDGGVILAAGLWTCVLIVWRIFDKEGSHTNHGLYVTTTGIEWGIFIALGVAGFMAYAGSRIRLAHEPEPPLPGESPAHAGGAGVAPAGGDAGRPHASAASPPRRPRIAEIADPPPRRPPRPVGAANPPPPPRARPELETATWSYADDEPPTVRAPANEPEPPTRQLTPGTEEPDPPTRQIPPPGDGPAKRGASRRPIEFPDIDSIEIEDPPPSRLKRSAPSARRLPMRDDVPTLPFDHPDE